MSRIGIDARIISKSTGRYVERLLNHLQDIDHDNTYFVLLEREDFVRWIPKAKNFKPVLADFPIYTFGEQLGFARLLYSLRLDLMHFTMPQQPLLYRGRVVTTIHDLTLTEFVNKREESGLKAMYRHRVKPAVFKSMLQSVIGRSERIIVPSGYTAAQLINKHHVDPAKIEITPLAAEIPATKAKAMPALKDMKFALYVGNAYPHKNLKRLVEAAAQLPKDTKLVLGGKPDYFWHELEKFAAHRKAGNVEFIGFPADAELVWLYKNASLFIYPSLSEGFGLQALEAMQYGLPVAAANATSLPEVCGDAAVYFDPKNVAEMGEVISKTLRSQKKLAELKKAGAEQVKKFSWMKTAEQTLDIYRSLL